MSNFDRFSIALALFTFNVKGLQCDRCGQSPGCKLKFALWRRLISGSRVLKKRMDFGYAAGLQVGLRQPEGWRRRS
jgi:hypothetical protein